MIECRLIENIGRKYTFNISWNSVNGEYHYIEHCIMEEQYNVDPDELAKLFTTPIKCQKCDQGYKNEELQYGCGSRWLYNTDNGDNDHVGDMFYAPWLHDSGKCMWWDNCNDPRGHIIIRMPDGGYWDTNSRASNCTMKEDRNHRCWVKHGEPPQLTIDKNGLTCGAGAGSIQMITWHGFLRDGKLVN